MENAVFKTYKYYLIHYEISDIMVSKQGTYNHYNPTWGSWTAKENQQGETFIKEVVEEFKNLKSMADKLHDLENFYKAAKSKMEKQKSGINSQYEEEIEKLKKESDKRNEERKEKQKRNT